MNSIELDFDIEHARFTDLEEKRTEKSLLGRFISAFLYVVAASGVYLCSLVGLTFLQFSEHRLEPVHFYLLSLVVPLLLMILYIKIAKVYHQLFPVVLGILSSSILGIFIALVIEENIPR